MAFSGSLQGAEEENKVHSSTMALDSLGSQSGLGPPSRTRQFLLFATRFAKPTISIYSPITTHILVDSASLGASVARCTG